MSLVGIEHTRGNGRCEAADLDRVLSSVCTSKNTGVMFLCEVALGKEHTITKDNCSLKKAPAGFDSVVARGSVEPGLTRLLISQRCVSFCIKGFMSVKAVKRRRPDMDVSSWTLANMRL